MLWRYIGAATLACHSSVDSRWTIDLLDGPGRNLGELTNAVVIPRSLERWLAYTDEYRLKGRQIIELPLSRDRVMFMVYLTKDWAVTTRIDQLGWRHYPLD